MQNNALKKFNSITCLINLIAANNLSNDNPTSAPLVRDANAPVDCIVSDWSDWTECSAACGGGVSERTRAILAEARNGGQVCPKRSVKKRRCNTHDC